MNISFKDLKAQVLNWVENDQGFRPLILNGLNEITAKQVKKFLDQYGVPAKLNTTEQGIQLVSY